ncbi:MAG TPA: peptide deformylase [Candidatus Peribacteraceae bacterium]|nr:peptide deformylase [Candidatus Peribacteraceae bacterium]
MPILSILTGADHPLLRKKTQRVPQITKEVKQLIKDMKLTVKAADGLGIAAPQVGQSWRVCLARINSKMTPLVNPEITWRSAEIDILEEGCLSLPGIGVEVPRAMAITLRFLDEKGADQERRLTDLDARVVQHEVDHLNGVLIVDYR